MPGVAFYFEDQDTDVFSGTPETLNAWNYAIKAAGDIDKVVIVNRTDLDLKPFDSDLDTIITTGEPDLAGYVVKLKTPWDRGDVQPISALDHAKVDWYFFGPAGGWGDDEPGFCFPQAGKGAPHSVHVATAVMFHRYQSLRN